MKPFSINPIPAIVLGSDISSGGDRIYDLAYVRQPCEKWIVDETDLFELSYPDKSKQGLALFCQLMELYVDPDLPKPFEVLIWSALEGFSQNFLQALEGQSEAMLPLGYASVIATLASDQAGFGLSHQMASEISKATEIEQVQIQASLSAETTELQLRMLSERLPDGESLERYVMIGEALAMRPFETAEEACASLVGTLRRWISRLEIPKINMTLDQMDDVSKQVTQENVLFWKQIQIEPEAIFEAIKRRAK